MVGGRKEMQIERFERGARVRERGRERGRAVGAHVVVREVNPLHVRAAVCVQRRRERPHAVVAGQRTSAPLAS